MAKRQRQPKDSPIEPSGAEKVIPIWKMDISEKQQYVATKYPKLWAAMGAIGQAFEVVEPHEARSVSGLVRALTAHKTKERMSHKNEVNRAKRAERIQKKLVKIAEQKTKLEKLQAELNA